VDCKPTDQGRPNNRHIQDSIIIKRIDIVLVSSHAIPKHFLIENNKTYEETKDKYRKQAENLRIFSMLSEVAVSAH